VNILKTGADRSAGFSLSGESLERLTLLEVTKSIEGDPANWHLPCPWQVTEESPRSLIAWQSLVLDISQLLANVKMSDIIDWTISQGGLAFERQQMRQKKNL